MRTRLSSGLRIGLPVGLLLAAVGAAGLLSGTGVWLTATLGPTAYLIVAHPRDVTARARNAIVGHGSALVLGLLTLAVFGLWNAPSVAVTHHESWIQIAAQGCAVALTLVVLTVADAHHAPAGATALLVSSGIAAPGLPLLGLVAGLAIVLVVAPLLARLAGPVR
jgi:hypothetical protein